MHRLVAAILLCARAADQPPRLPLQLQPCPETNPQIVGGLLFCQCSSASALAFAVEFPLAPASFPAWLNRGLARASSPQPIALTG